VYPGFPKRNSFCGPSRYFRQVSLSSIILPFLLELFSGLSPSHKERNRHKLYCIPRWDTLTSRHLQNVILLPGSAQRMPVFIRLHYLRHKK
jgi:hypothetical protein